MVTSLAKRWNSLQKRMHLLWGEQLPLSVGRATPRTCERSLYGFAAGGRINMCDRCCSFLASAVWPMMLVH